MAADLHCPNRCALGRFEALNTPVFVGRDGRYLGHDASRATFRCAECGSVAVDLAAASRQMLRDEAAGVRVLTCPACGTMMLPPEDDPFATVVECPDCETRFGVEDGIPHLHRDGFELDDEEDA